MFDVEKIRNDFPMIRNNKDLIYFDSSATSFKPQCVIDEVVHYYEHDDSNIHRGDYDISFEVSKTYDETRRVIADFIHAKDERSIVYTYGATSSLKTVAINFANKFLEKDDVILTSLVEHASNILPWFEAAEKSGATIKYVPLKTGGHFDLEAYEKCFEGNKVKVVALPQVSNVLGYIYPIKQIAKIAHEHGVLFHTDAVQAYGHIRINVDEMNIDMLSASGHKLGGPKGIGVLYIRKGIKIRSFIHGGAQERSRRAGTHNTPGIVGIGAAALLAGQDMTENIKKQEKLRNHLIERVLNEIPYSSTLKGNNVKIKKIVIKNTNQTKKYNNFSNSSTINSNASDDLPNVIALKSLDNFPIKKIDQINITPMIGLQNIGQTCYMNAALQCFSNTKALTSYFLNYNNLQYLKSNTITINGTNEPSLVIEYLRLVRHLWCDPPKSAYAPNEFKKAIGKMDSLFKDFEANDAKDFVNFMVMRLHDELNGVDNHLTKQNNLTPPPNILNPYDQIQVLQSYLYEFQINFNSFISNCFYGTTQGEFECQNCKMQIYQTGQNLPLVKYNYQTFFFLNFPLNEVSKYILSNQMLYMKYMNSGINPSSVVNLIDCFYYYQKDEILSCYCDRCFNNNAQVLTRTKLYVAPIYLILLFNRGKGIQYNIKITFPETLDTNGLFVNPSGLYQLYGVVKHYGDSSASGHFTAYCRSPIDRQWYYYNDAMVTPVNEQDKYQIQENGLTYMLFYNWSHRSCGSLSPQDFCAA